MTGQRVVCVLRSGGVYKPSHVHELQRQVSMHLPSADFFCMSDVQVDGLEVIPLAHGWPGWWSKMNLFHPSIRGDLLYFDLDTVVVGDISALSGLGASAMLSDFYYPERPASGVMFLTEADRSKVWAAWKSDPEGCMRKCKAHGDQQFIGEVLRDAKRLQDEFPGLIVSYKVHVAKGLNKRSIGNGTVPDGASVVCFHGRPRPWHLKSEWVPDYGN